MRLEYTAISHRGLVRETNEDALLVGNQILRDDSDSFGFDIPADGIVFPAIVCDGVGGNHRGEEASMTACDEMRKVSESLDRNMSENDLILRLKQDVVHCNNIILDKAKGCGMATTLTGLIVLGERALVLNAGDSRTYRLRYDNLKQLTHDHAADRDGRRVITNCLGLDDVTLDVTATAIVPDDIFIVCSDGLFDMISDELIAANASSAERLLQLALDAGGHDNISIITLKFF